MDDEDAGTTRCFRGCCTSRDVRLDVPMADLKGCQEVIARGGASRVMRGTYEGAPVAVKFPSLPTSEDLNRFHKELGIHLEFTGEDRAADHIVPLVAARAHPPHYVTAMPLARCNLEQLLQARAGAMDLGEALSLSLQVALGVKSLHDKAYVHRDLKPANVLIFEDGAARLTDFQLTEREAALIDLFSSSEARTSKQEKKPSGGFHKKLMVGTLEYMAPEILTKQGHTRKSDVYSLAILINQVITGVFPYSDCSKERPGCHTVLEMGYGHMELKAAVVSEGLRPTLMGADLAGGIMGHERDPIRSPHREEALKRINAMLGSCWSLDPDDRPSIGDVCALLRTVLADCSEGFLPSAQREEGGGEEAPMEVAEAANGAMAAEAVTQRVPQEVAAAFFDGGRGEIFDLSAGYFQMIGGRDSQEDRVVQRTPFLPFSGAGGATGENGAHLLAVFDGHRGSEASEYCAKTIETALVKAAAAEAGGSHGANQAEAPLDTPSLPSRALSRAFRSLDHDFISTHADTNAGATALVCLICNSRIYVANCGDCRGVLGSVGGETRALTRDHTTACASERERFVPGALAFQYDTWRIGKCGLQVRFGTRSRDRSINRSIDQWLFLLHSLQTPEEVDEYLLTLISNLNLVTFLCCRR